MDAVLAWQAASKPKQHHGMPGPSVFSELAIVDMIASLKGLPSAKDFGAEFHMFQNNKVQLMSCYPPVPRAPQLP